MKTVFRSPRPVTYRRGVTLVEMLVAVALLVLMMTVIVQVFGAATGAVSSQRVYQELDTNLRQLDSTIRQDLSGATARFTPPLNPKDNLGYFEYIENSFADNQGEDADDCLRFTAKAPEGQVFIGRMYVQNAVTSAPANLSAPQSSNYYNSQPITITSQFAEIIYFLRNGNLYRRVLLVAPERQSSIQQVPAFQFSPFNPTGAPGFSVSWQGMNDLSAHPSPTGTTSLQPQAIQDVIILNTLSDLTNRENRFAAPRFVNDFIHLNDTGTPDPDGIPDDQNGDSVPDFWPSLYFNALSAKSVPTGRLMLNEPVAAPRSYGSFINMAFPYIYPYAYSRPDQETMKLGWIHSPNPNWTSTLAGGWLNVLNQLNHNPLIAGDSLNRPYGTTDQIETYWGFPTWRETMNTNWSDPYHRLGIAPLSQSLGLTPLNPNVLPGNTIEFLPPMITDVIPNTSTHIRLVPQLYNDGYGSNSYFTAYTNARVPANLRDALWKQLWEEDLIMTGVRSFDVKALDNAYGGYVDLGWGDDLRLYAPYPPYNTNPSALASLVPPFLGAFSGQVQTFPPLPQTGIPYIQWPPTVGQNKNLYQETFAHEGRIPPLVWDLKADAQTGLQNVGEDNPTTIRLRRVWDSWSTDYSNAPASGINPGTGQPTGVPFDQAIYPSYPPPYPLPLRGLQIQIRVADPRGERTKVLTIRQDFSDKL